MNRAAIVFVVSCLILIAAAAAAVDVPDTRLLAQPTVSADNVAFAYDNDLWLTSRSGGPARRLNSHEGRESNPRFSPDGVWMPDGSAVLFFSGRSVHTSRYVQLFTVPVPGGFPSRLPIPNGLRGSYNADGSKIAYIPICERNTQWKNDRGVTTSRIWLSTSRPSISTRWRKGAPTP